MKPVRSITAMPSGWIRTATTGRRRSCRAWAQPSTDRSAAGKVAVAFPPAATRVTVNDTPRSREAKPSRRRVAPTTTTASPDAARATGASGPW
jgi:hypothetical protein